jgi:hypothetical protein
MERTWKPTVAGILSIVAGALSAVAWFLLILGVSLFMVTSRTGSPHMLFNIPVPGLLVLILAIPFFLVWALAIAGGIFSLKYRYWEMALAGSIAATIIAPLLGIPALVFIALSKGEFEETGHTD